MRGIIFVGVLSLIFPGRLAAGAEVDSATIARLCEQVRSGRMLLVDRRKPEVIWSDGAMIEVGRTFPAELEQLLSATTMTRDLQPMITRIMQDTPPGWQNARVASSDRDQKRAVIESVDGKVTTHVASPYFDYLRERYPRAQIRIKTVSDPVVFLVDGAFQACIMPLAMPKPGKM